MAKADDVLLTMAVKALSKSTYSSTEPLQLRLPGGGPLFIEPHPVIPNSVIAHALFIVFQLAICRAKLPLNLLRVPSFASQLGHFL